MSHWTDAHCHLQDRYLSSDESVVADIRATLERAFIAGVDRVVVIGTDAQTSKRSARDHRVGGTGADLRHGRPAPPRRPPGPRSGRGAGPRRPPTTGRHRRVRARLLLRAFAARRAASGVRRPDRSGPRTRPGARRCTRATPSTTSSTCSTSEGVPARTVIHCFTGGPEDVEGCLALGCDISISGVVTFKNASRCATRCASCRSIGCTWRPTVRSSHPCHTADARTNPRYVSVVGEFVAELRAEDLGRRARRDRAQHGTSFRASRSVTRR